MRRSHRIEFALSLLLVFAGCASIAPPSESTVAILHSYRNDLQKRVAAGQLTPSQRDALVGYATTLKVQDGCP